MLPCGAGKSLVGVSAAVRVGKSCLCLATNAVSVTQWRYQFLTWSNIKEEQICKFTADTKELFTTPAGVLVTTFHMIAQTGKRSEESQRVMEAIESREWGLLLMDEVRRTAGTTRHTAGTPRHAPAYIRLGYTHWGTPALHVP